MTDEATRDLLPSGPWGRRKKVWVGVGILFCMVVISFLVAWADRKVPTNDGAVYVCEQNITNQLKSPASATFGSSPEVVNLGGGEYQVLGTVDAQNSFGAKIRSDWSCKATWTGKGNWHTSANLL